MAERLAEIHGLFKKGKSKWLKGSNDVVRSYLWNQLKYKDKMDHPTVALQDRKYYLFERQFALRPDIVLRNEDTGRVIVLDTKWKVLINDPRKNYGISQADMYQMYAYAKKYQTDEVFAENEKISFVSDDGIQVTVAFVNCHRSEDLKFTIKNLLY